MNRHTQSPAADAPIDDDGEPPGNDRAGDAHRGEARVVQRRDHGARDQWARGKAHQIGRARRRGPTPAAVERGGKAEQVGEREVLDDDRRDEGDDVGRWILR